MRHVLELLILTVSLQVAAASSLVGWWQFNEGTGTNALDSSGYGNTAHLTNGTTWVTGHEGTGYALSFDGENDYASIYYSTNFNWNTNFTITAWVLCLTNSRLTAVGGWTNNLWNGFSLEQIDEDRFDFEYQDRTEAGEGAHRSMGSGLGYTSNAWFFVAGVRSNNQVWVYINGEIGSVSTPITNANALGPPTGIGIGSRCWNTADASWRGYVDDVRVYNRNLSMLEITNLFNGTDPVDPPSGLTMNVVTMNVGSIVPAASTPPAEDNFQLGILTTNSPQDFICEFENPGTLHVEWGDGTTNDFNASITNTHSYTSAGAYTIKMSGSVQHISLFVYPGLGTPDLVTSISTIKGITGITNCYEMFKHCHGITNIPAGLFDEFQGIVKFNDLFIAVDHVTSIPSGLFDTQTNVNTFYAVCDNMDILANIPSGLFDLHTNVVNFAWSFAKCYAITNIPTGLFDNNPDVTTFANTFYRCFDLLSIPPTLFANNTNVTSYANCFYECSALTGHTPTNSAGLKLWELPGPPTGTACFRDCTNLTDYADIPADWK